MAWPDTVLISGRKSPNSSNGNSILCRNITPYNQDREKLSKRLIRREENNVPPIIPFIPSYSFPSHQVQAWETPCPVASLFDASVPN